MCSCFFVPAAFWIKVPNRASPSAPGTPPTAATMYDILRPRIYLFLITDTRVYHGCHTRPAFVCTRPLQVTSRGSVGQNLTGNRVVVLKTNLYGEYAIICIWTKYPCSKMLQKQLGDGANGGFFMAWVIRSGNRRRTQASMWRITPSMEQVAYVNIWLKAYIYSWSNTWWSNVDALTPF